MTEMTEPKPFRVEVVVRAPRDTVWRALTDTEQIRQWFGWDYEGLDGEITFIFVEHSTPHPPDLIQGDNGQRIEIDAGAGSDAGATGPVVVRAVLPGSLDDAAWEDIYDGMEEGWRAFFEQLRFWLERRPSGRRRTIYLTGRARPEHVLAAMPEGEDWHQSRYQRMSVDADGHLLGVGAQQPLTAHDPGPISLTVTTYGLDDTAFAAAREVWAARWRAIVADPEVTTEAGTVAEPGTVSEPGTAGQPKTTGKAGTAG
jgi:hypothetical protein